MVYIKLLIGILITGSLIVGVCGDYTEQNNIVSVSQDINIEDFKNTSIEGIKKYYNEVPNFDKFKFTMEHETVEDIKESLDNVINNLKDKNGYEYLADEQRQNRIKELETAKNIVENGKIYMNWIPNEPNVEYPNEDGFYQVTLNDKTKEIDSMEYTISQDLRNIKSENFVSIEQSKKIAENFIVQNNLSNIKNMKLVRKMETKSHINAAYDVSDSVEFYYEDMNDSSKKTNVMVDRILGKVNRFNVRSEAQ